jgi:hypothetical protein
MERLVTHANVLDMAWRNGRPKLYQWEFDAYFKVVQIVMLRGSKHAIASAYDERKREWCVIVYAFVGEGKVVPVTRTPTKSKAHHLTARYFDVHGHGDTIVVAYVTRCWANSLDAEKAVKTK